MGNTGIEYRNRDGSNPFETFLKYTDEKKNSSAQLAKIFDMVGNELNILDVGAGNGAYLIETLKKVRDLNGCSVTLIEPSKDLSTQLMDRFSSVIDPANTKVITSKFNTFSSADKYDIVLASHFFYHTPKVNWRSQLKTMLSYLKANGQLILILREIDDAYDFKMAFKPLIHDEHFKALTLNDVLEALPDRNKLNVARYKISSKLNIPVIKNPTDTISIIEFYLNDEWQNIPKDIQLQAMDFIKAKNYIFQQNEGIAVIKKLMKYINFDLAKPV